MDNPIDELRTRLRRTLGIERLHSRIDQLEAQLNERIGQLESQLRNLEPSGWDRSRERWRNVQPDAGLTWGRELTGDAFIAKVFGYNGFHPDARILEIGPGYGRLLKACLDLGVPFAEYVGVDISQQNVDYLRQCFEDQRVNFVVADAESLVLGNRYNLLLSSLVFKHLFPTFEATLRNCAAQLDAGALICFDVIEGDHSLFEADGGAYIKFYTRSEIEEILQRSGLDLIDFTLVKHDENHERLLTVAKKSGTPGTVQAASTSEQPVPETPVGSRSVDTASGGPQLSCASRGQQIAESASGPVFFSRHGGLWVDRRDADAEVEQRLESGKLTESEADQLRKFVRDGFVVLQGGVPANVCDEFEREISRAWIEGDERLKVQVAGGAYQPLTAGTRTERARVVDSYVYYDAARRALLATPIVEFLRLIFERSPLLFQSLSFEVGSEQRMHQDTAYVVVSSPLEFAASWIALEDIQQGSGELSYYVGSHRLPEYNFSGEFKSWNSERDGLEQHDEWAGLLHSNAKRLGLQRETFLPKKGDVLIWSADLAHGGSPVTNRNLSRRSLVGHYCPEDVRPNYFDYAPEHRETIRYGDGAYASVHYPLAPADS